jgi:hypothetical protein
MFMSKVENVENDNSIIATPAPSTEVLPRLEHDKELLSEALGFDDPVKFKKFMMDAGEGLDKILREKAKKDDGLGRFDAFVELANYFDEKWETVTKENNIVEAYPIFQFISHIAMAH